MTDKCQPVNRQESVSGKYPRLKENPGLPFVRMAKRTAQVVPGSPIGERIYEALVADEGRAIDKTEAELGMSKGHLGRIIRGERWKDNQIDAELAWRLAELLHVRFEWLVLGQNPKRRGGRSETKAEIAIRFARQNGCAEEAIQAVWERNKAREAELEVDDWVVDIFQEAARQKRRAIPPASPNLPVSAAENRAIAINEPKPEEKVVAVAPKRPKKGAA